MTIKHKGWFVFVWAFSLINRLGRQEKWELAIGSIIGLIIGFGVPHLVTKYARGFDYGGREKTIEIVYLKPSVPEVAAAMLALQEARAETIARLKSIEGKSAEEILKEFRRSFP